MGIKNKTQKHRNTILIAIAIIFITTIISPYLFRPISTIRLEIVLRTTPMGMYIDDAFEVLKGDSVLRNTRRWRNVRRHGNNMISAYTYHWPPYISAEWYFDDEGRLIDIYIRKHWTA